MKNSKKSKSWLPIICLTLTGFIFNTSEFIPIGLLLEIGKTFSTNEYQTGLLISAYAGSVALLSLPLIVLTAKIGRKALFIGIVALFTISHILSYLSDSYYAFMVTRLLVSFSHAIFWGIIPAMCLNVSPFPEHRRHWALSILLLGGILSSVFGVPMGTFLVNYISWQSVFLIIGIIALLICITLLKILPSIPNKNVSTFHRLPIILKNKELRYLFIMTLLFVVGWFIFYSYTNPFINKVAGFVNNEVAIFLSIVGFSGIVGGLFFNKYNNSKINVRLVSAIVFLICLLSIKSLCHNYWSLMIVAAVVGMSYTAIYLSIQSGILAAATKDQDMASAIFSSIFNVGIGGGAFIGGLVIDRININYLGYFSGCFISIFIVVIFLLIRTKQKESTLG